MSGERSRRRAVVVAGHRGDVAVAKAHLHDSAPEVRASALGALARAGALDADTHRTGLGDADPIVRRRAAELAATAPAVSLLATLEDDDPAVVEAAAWACGERGADPEVVAALARLVREHPDALVREAAVAALGALGDRAGLDAILVACRDKPAVRRRAVLALAPFEGPAVDAALEEARHDRDWQVRQAAEDLLA